MPAVAMLVVPVAVPTRHVKVVAARAMARELGAGAVAKVVGAVRAVMASQVPMIRAAVVTRPRAEMVGAMVTATGKLMVPSWPVSGKVPMARAVTEAGKLWTAVAVIVVPVAGGILVAEVAGVAVARVAPGPAFMAGNVVTARTSAMMPRVVMLGAVFAERSMALILAMHFAAHLRGIRPRRLVYAHQSQRHFAIANGKAEPGRVRLAGKQPSHLVP